MQKIKIKVSPPGEPPILQNERDLDKWQKKIDFHIKFNIKKNIKTAKKKNNSHVWQVSEQNSLDVTYVMYLSIFFFICRKQAPN